MPASPLLQHLLSGPGPRLPPLLPCSYLLMCAPLSVVEQCAAQPPLRELRPSMQLYSSVQQLCVGNGSAPSQEPACQRCSAQSFDPDKVTVQALQGNCADPLGELEPGARRGCPLSLPPAQQPRPRTAALPAARSAKNGTV
jgi:hypothetical protein